MKKVSPCSAESCVFSSGAPVSSSAEKLTGRVKINIVRKILKKTLKI